MSFVKAIAHSSQGGNALAVRSKDFAKLFDVCIYGSVVAKEIIAPNFIDKLFAGKGDSAVLYKKEEQVVLAGGHINALAVDGDHASGEVNGKPAVGVYFLCFRNGSTAAF